MFGSTVCAVVIYSTFPSFLLFRGKGPVRDTYLVWFHLDSSPKPVSINLDFNSCVTLC